MKKNKVLKTIRDYALIALGSSIYAFGFIMFLMPNEIPLGGIIGIALIFNTLWGAPLGIFNILLNFPLIAGGMKYLGKEFFFRTAWAIATASIMLDVLKPIVPAYKGDVLLSCLYGGIVLGIGFGLVFKAGGTSGGTDVVAKLLHQLWSVNIGLTNLVSNAVIIGANAIVYKSMESALYGIIATYLTGAVIDQIVYGGDKQKNAFIITNRPKEVSKIIMDTLHHGVTSMDATGMYSGTGKNVLMTVARRHETSMLKNMIAETDPEAFVILSEVTEVFGNGFKQYENVYHSKKTKGGKANGAK